MTLRKIRIGTVRADGFVFRGYEKSGNSVRERWISPAAAAKRKVTTARLTQEHYYRVKADPIALAAYNQRAAGYAHASRRRDPKAHMLSRARIRAKQRGVAFALDRADFTIPTSCPVLGIPLRIADGCAADHSPELDRIEPSKGYVRGNVIVVSRRANRIKTNATLVEIRAVLEFYEALTGAIP